MKAGKKMSLVALLILGISLVPLHSAMAAKRLGLHVTQEELDIWRQRANNGPYKSAGDVGTYSPGDWDRIVSNKDSFMSNPSSDIYAGQTADTCVRKGDEVGRPWFNNGYKIRDAAFYSLVKDDAAVRAQVLSTLKAQIAQPGVDFSNGSKWCLYPPENRVLDVSPGFGVAEWVLRIIYAYDYVRSYVSASDQQTIETWLANAATYFRINSDETITALYSDWDNGILNGTGLSLANECDNAYWGPIGRTHAGGNKLCVLGLYFNNRRATMTAVYAMVGIMINDATMKNWAKRWVKEYIKYHVYADGTVNELGRGHASQGTHEAIGWAYSHYTYGLSLQISDVFARAGDMSLYEYVTSEGEGATVGGPKSVKSPADFYVSASQGNRIIYCWDRPQDLTGLIDGVWYPGDTFYAYETFFAMSNIYWQDPAITADYLDLGPKNKLGTTVVREPAWSFMGAGRSFPGVLFMFGQMEGKVWPYPLQGGDSVPPSPPRGLRIQ